MAGFIFSVSSKEGIEGVKRCISNGYYAARVPKDLENLKAKQIAASVFTDYLSMKEGDNVYFLSNRKLYGVGKLINIGQDCKYKNYIDANELTTKDILIEGDGILIDEDPCARWICFFVPENKFFGQGVDMDDVLRYKPASFRMLRAFQDRSFIKIDDEENRALKEFIYLNNKSISKQMEFKGDKYKELNEYNLEQYRLLSKEALATNYNNETGQASLEMLVEAAVVEKLINGKDEKWDYVTHQVIASPFKPLAYIDKMDVFAYKFLNEYPQEEKPIEKYLIIELKKGKANKESVLQLMRYVDWVCNEYASGDYSLIEARVIAADYVKNIGKEKTKSAIRTYISSTHPITTDIWDDLRLIKYSISDSGEIKFDNYSDFNAEDLIIEKLDMIGLEHKKGSITIDRKKCNSKFRIQNKKVAFYTTSPTDSEKITLTSNGWTLYELDKIIDSDCIDSIIKEIVQI